MVRYFPIPSDTIPSLVHPSSPLPPNTPTSSVFSSLPAPGQPSTSQPIAPPTPQTSNPISPAPANIHSSGAPIAPTDTAPTSVQQQLPPTPITASSHPSVPIYMHHAISPNLLVRVLDLLDRHLAALEDVLSTLEARFVGASVLVVYEGDPSRLQESLDRWDAKPDRPIGAKVLHSPDMDEEEEDEDEDDDSESSDSDDDEEGNEMDGPAEDAKIKRRCPPVTVRMIDFAHTRLVEGDGPDQGVLKGMRTLRGMVQGRRREVAAAAAEQQ